VHKASQIAQLGKQRMALYWTGLNAP